MRYLQILLIVSLIAGCAQSGYKQFYKPYVDANTLPDVQLLKKGEEPQVFGTDDFDRDIKILRAKRYIVIGQSSFNGGYEDTKNAAEQAKTIGATIVLTNSQYTNTQTTTSTLFLPDNKTTYHSGSVSGSTSYNSAYGGYLGSSNTYGSYSGSSTTYGTKAVPYTTHQRRYDQNAVYLVKSTQKVRYGISVADLTPEKRSEIERNTGALIDIVLEDTPAFYANVMAGDILISVDGSNVRNAAHAIEVMKTSGNSEYSILKVLRNGKEKEIRVEF